MTRLERQQGLTIVELIVAMVITIFLAAAILATMLGWLQAYSAATIRSELQTNNRRALDIMSNDIRAASNAVVYNQWPDPNAPTAYAYAVGSSPADTDQQYFWRSDAHSLLLIQPARKTNGDAIYDDPALFTGKKDNYVYYVNMATRTLYRRTIPVPLATYPESVLAIATCGSLSASGGCPELDMKLADNVKINSDGTPGFSINYYNNIGAEIPDPNGATSARSVVITLDLEIKQGSQPITATNKLKMVFRNN